MRVKPFRRVFGVWQALNSFGLLYVSKQSLLSSAFLLFHSASPYQLQTSGPGNGVLRHTSPFKLS